MNIMASDKDHEVTCKACKSIAKSNNEREAEEEE